MRRRLASISLGMLLVSVGLVPARASPLFSLGNHTVFFDDLTDSLVVSIDGVPVPTGGETFSITGMDLGFTFTDVDIYEPGTNMLSDTIHLVKSGGMATFAFASDGTGITLTPSTESNRIIMTETGGIQDAGNITWSGGTIDVKFRSDVGSVPEPSAVLVLFGIGLLAIVAKPVRAMAGRFRN